jgi:23S rRNA (cytosine1962-C5)-methyltransferase
MSDTLLPLLAAAFDERAGLLARLHAEQTDAYRLFHGSVEGHPGLTVDRYGELLLVQCFHSPLATQALAALRAFYAERLPGLALVYNDRSQANSRIANPLPPEEIDAATLPRQMHEMGVAYRIAGRHAGQDPWLFLDLRAARRRVMHEAPGKSLLNLFAYTCGVGIAAAKAGARFVVNVDFPSRACRSARKARGSTRCRYARASSSAMPSPRCASTRGWARRNGCAAS